MPESSQARDQRSEAGPVRIRAVTGRTVLRLKSWAAGSAQTCQKIRIAGLDLPQEVGAVGAGELRALCTGPSDWLLVAPGSLSLPARGAIEADCVRECLALVDLSSGLSVLEVSGPGTRQVLAKGCGLDFDLRSFAHPQCTRTRLAQLAVVIDAHEGGDAFDLCVARSHASWLKEWLTDSALEVY